MSEEKQEDKAAVFEVLASCIEDGAENSEQSADELAKDLAIPADKENAEKIRNTVVSFVSSYKQKTPETSDIEWLEKEFAKYPAVWKNTDELKNAAADIVETVERYGKERDKLAEYKAKGLTRESCLAKATEDGAKANGVTDFGKYAGEIDKALGRANADNVRLMYRVDGGVNQQRNSKDDKDAETAQELIDKDDYHGQKKHALKVQGKGIEDSVETIVSDGIKPRPLSRKQAKERQYAMQEAQEAKLYEWNAVNKVVIARNIAQKAGLSAAIAVGFQGARILGRRAWNFVTGEKNNPIEEDAREFAESVLKSGAGAGLAIAATGGITVAIKSGWLGQALKSTPVGHVANAVCVGVENVKVLYLFAAGKINGEEALDNAGDATCSLVGSLALASKGMAIGAAVGSVLGPVGMTIGGAAGGIVGGMAGGTAGHAIWEAGKAIVKPAVNFIKSTGSAAVNAGASVFMAVDFFKGVTNA